MVSLDMYPCDMNCSKAMEGLASVAAGDAGNQLLEGVAALALPLPYLSCERSKGLLAFSFKHRCPVLLRKAKEVAAGALYSKQETQNSLSSLPATHLAKFTYRLAVNTDASLCEVASGAAAAIASADTQSAPGAYLSLETLLGHLKGFPRFHNLLAFVGAEMIKMAPVSEVGGGVFVKRHPTVKLAVENLRAYYDVAKAETMAKLDNGYQPEFSVAPTAAAPSASMDEAAAAAKKASADARQAAAEGAALAEELGAILNKLGVGFNYAKKMANLCTEVKRLQGLKSRQDEQEARQSILEGRLEQQQQQQQQATADVAQDLAAHKQQVEEAVSNLQEGQQAHSSTILEMYESQGDMRDTLQQHNVRIKALCLETRTKFMAQEKNSKGQAEAVKGLQTTVIDVACRVEELTSQRAEDVERQDDLAAQQQETQDELQACRHGAAVFVANLQQKMQHERAVDDARFNNVAALAYEARESCENFEERADAMDTTVNALNKWVARTSDEVKEIQSSQEEQGRQIMENRDGLETAKKDATAREQQLWTAIKAITSRVEHAESRAGHAEAEVASMKKQVAHCERTCLRMESGVLQAHARAERRGEAQQQQQQRRQDRSALATPVPTPRQLELELEQAVSPSLLRAAAGQAGAGAGGVLSPSKARVAAPDRKAALLQKPQRGAGGGGKAPAARRLAVSKENE